MAALSVPEDGLVLRRTPDHGPPSQPPLPPQVLRLSLAQEATEEILKSFQNRETVSIRFGKRVSVQHDNKSHTLFTYPEPYPSELYRRSTDDLNTFYFSGKLSHRLEAQKAQNDTAKADEALANLENSLKSYEEQKASNEARFVTDKDELRHLTVATQKGRGHQLQPTAIRKDRLLHTNNRSTSSSPFLGGASSPANGHGSSTRSIPTSVSKDQVRLNAIKIPLLHLLAVNPLKPEALVETLHAPKEDCHKLLHRYAKDVREANGKQELKDKAYRDLDLWKFPYPNENDRQAAIDRTISAFDRMRISRNDQTWETLLPVAERGKGKGSELSRLKLGQAGLNGATPKVGSTPRPPHSVPETDTDHSKPAGKAKGSTTRTKPRSGTNESLNRNGASSKETTKQSKEVHGKDTTKRERRKAPPSGRFKSSEVIADSDEELESAHTPVGGTTKVRGKSSPASRSSRPAAATPSSRPPLSSSKTAAAVVGSLMPSAAMGRPRSESATTKASPRPRTDSSPQKPSPLALSPPTNAADMDNSHSTKPTSLSSATSSPTTSPQRDRGQKGSVPAKTSESIRPPANALKRKAEEQSPPAPKRQQVNGNHVVRPIPNGVGTSSRGENRITKNPATVATSSSAVAAKTTTATASSSQRSRTPSSSSGSTSTTASSATSAAAKPPPSLQPDLQLKSRLFKIQYARYQALHAKIMAMPEGERDAEEIKVLRKMHVRIGELKRDIWEAWEKKKQAGLTC